MQMMRRRDRHRIDGPVVEPVGQAVEVVAYYTDVRKVDQAINMNINLPGAGGAGGAGGGGTGAGGTGTAPVGGAPPTK